eukprot:CAMPEP_0181445732 /NCGR_PEP_ID=MMETSP1110-20121109/25739_1 /TAXON_ID=174948 /ORGANISM="Symbiodinium sp., Strain CCMP421" /LENGTH=779 /DNA_ID=CAMNT_0023569785 /DNA_START=91 /DNA_END=2430 /DNA_ORIENTATION=+
MVDQKGRVSQILSSPLAYGNTVLPPGSVAVTFSDETSTLWISEEHVGVMLRRAEAERDESEEDRPSADGWPQDASKLGVGGYTSLSSMLGAMSSFFGLDKNGLATKQEDQEDSKEESDGKVAFAEGDVVDVWNYDASAWDFGAVVSQVLHEPLSLGGSSLPAGSILISLNGALRWLTPDLISLVVRRSDGVQPAASCDSDGSNPKQIVDTASTDASQPDDEDLVHKSLSTSTAASGRQPDVAPDAPPSPVNASGPKPSQSSGDVADLDEDQAPVTPATSTGSQGSGKAGPLPTPQATVIATLKVPDTMGPSAEFDGTPVSSRHSSPPVSPRTKDHKPTLEAPPDYERSKQRVLVVGPGFGRELNPQQGQLLESAGFQVRWVFDLPNPESPSFPILHYLPVLKQAIDEFAPHLLVCASKGGAYVTAVWQAGLWTGPTLIINRHPTLTSLPKGSRVVLAHGSNDEYYQYRREDLEALMRSGSSNSCFLYYTANSGVLGRGHTRLGDKHNMESLKLWDTLPRLCDAAMAPECPELTIMRSWRSMLAQERLDAEEWLGYVPGLRTLWQSEDQKGMDDQILFEVHSESEEYEKVASIFRAQPAVSRAYADMNPAMWQHINILKIERVETGMQEDGSAEPYYKALQRGVENQGVPFVPGLHTRWVFHGSSAVDSIVSNPISGFQPLMSGTRGNALWGSGTYFARDAKYVYDGGFCSPGVDGSRQILLCLLMNGFVCLGDSEHKGVLPFRQGRHRYNASVDSLSNPEIFVTQSPGAAYPAYVITFS